MLNEVNASRLKRMPLRYHWDSFSIGSIPFGITKTRLTPNHSSPHPPDSSIRTKPPIPYERGLRGGFAKYRKATLRISWSAQRHASMRCRPVWISKVAAARVGSTFLQRLSTGLFVLYLDLREQNSEFNVYWFALIAIDICIVIRIHRAQALIVRLVTAWRALHGRRWFQAHDRDWLPLDVHVTFILNC